MRTIGCLLALGLAAPALAGGEVLSQDVDSNGHGVTVLRACGSDYEIGYTQGELLADRIVLALDDIRSGMGAYYSSLRALAHSTDWLDPGLEQEMQGVVDGVLAANPGANLDLTDIHVANGLGDWAYLCRSHSAWGSRVAPPYSTLSTRRLDYALGYDVEHEHLLVARVREDGGPDWLSFGWPGFVNVVTAVNENGTLVSLHDYNSSTGTPAAGATSRAAVARYAVAHPWSGPLTSHVTSFFGTLSAIDILTGTFINFYAPDGAAGVVTCERATGCHTLRLPQSDYYDGEVLLTTNSETDGHTTPYGGDFMATYYDDTTPKTMTDHFELMGDSGLHLVTVGVRAPADISVRFQGKLPSGTTTPIDLEWTELFAPCDGTTTNPPVTGSSSRPPSNKQDGGCMAVPAPVLAWIGVLLLRRRRPRA